MRISQLIQIVGKEMIRNSLAVILLAWSSMTSASTLTDVGTIKHFSSLKGNYELTVVDKVTVKSGHSLTKYQQSYHGVPVFSRTVVADNDNKSVSRWHGQVLQGIDKELPSLSTKLTVEEAIDILIKETDIPDDSEIKYKEGSKTIYQDSSGIARLAYEVSFYIEADDPLRPTAIIDANTGEIIERWDNLNTEKLATGPGGNQRTGKHEYGVDLPPMLVNDECQMSTCIADTVDMKHENKGGEIFTITPCTPKPDNQYKYINGAYAPLNDAHTYAHVVHHLFNDWYGVPPLNFKIRSRVHFRTDYHNAFWNGREITFGDGGIFFYPLVSLDIVSHELAHGFTGQHSNLIYKNQSGGMNEAFSDIAGEAAKYYYHPISQRPNDWLVGADIYVIRGKALRYFEEPEKDGRSIGHASKYKNGMDVHFSSGVYNRAFFLLSHKPNWDVHRAFDVFVLANQIFWTREETFETGACGVKRAARSLNYNEQDIIDTFEAVGVDATCGELPLPEPIEIFNNKPLRELSATKGTIKLFYIEIPKHTSSFEVTTSKGTGDVDLYIKAGNIPRPELNDFDCGSDSVSTREYCRVAKPKPGLYFIYLLAFDDYQGVKLFPRLY